MNNLDKESVRDLLNRIAAGDDQASRTLYQHYSRQMFAFIRFRVANDETAEDVLQETFVVAFKKPDAWDAASQYSSWLCGIALNHIQNVYRHVKRNKVDTVGDEAELDRHAEPVWDVAIDVECRESTEIILACIDKLPQRQRDVMYWYAIEEASNNEISEMMGIADGTVKSRLFHARANVSRCLDRAFGSLRSRGRYD